MKVIVIYVQKDLLKVMKQKNVSLKTKQIQKIKHNKRIKIKLFSHNVIQIITFSGKMGNV